MHFKDIIIHHLGSLDAEHFAKWDVGDPYQTIEGQDWPYLWNEFHGNELEIYGFGDINEDIEKMIEVWRRKNEKARMP